MGDRVAVALSGGKDSVALFHALLREADKLNIEVLAINVEHGIRGNSSVRDSEFVKKLCDNARKRLLFYKVDAPAYAREHGMSIETAARELRYSCFLGAVREGLCDKIATAHHAGDNAESVLLNVLRGSGLKGICGIPAVSYGVVVRPMLNVTREEIDEYVSAYGLEYVTDESNSDDAYSRNFLRNNVIPLIKSRYPDFEGAIGRLSRLCSDDDEYLRTVAAGLVTYSLEESRIDISAAVPMPILTRAVIIAMKEAGLDKDYEFSHVSAVAALINLPAGCGVDLPHGFRAEKGYGEIVVYKLNVCEPFEFAFEEGIFNLPGGVLSIEKVTLPEMQKNEKVPFFAKERASGTLYINCGAAEGCIIRQRRTGDVIRKFGGGSKPLKEFLIDLKTERRLRDSLPVCAMGNNIVFVAGVEISSDAAVTGNEAYKVTYKRR